MDKQPLGKTEKLFIAMFGTGFLVLFAGFIFIVAKLVKG
jgi:hypothetical protein